MVIKKGDKVKVDYIGKLEDGTIFDNSNDHPLEFEAGSGQLIKGFDDAVLGMDTEQEKTIKIQPHDAYGEKQPHLVQKVPRSALPPGEPKEGMMLLLKSPEGQQFPARITAVSATEVTLDLNHPLAGKTLVFTIRVLNVG